MNQFRRFITNEVGTATVSWVVLTAGIIVITLALFGKIWLGVNNTTGKLQDDVITAIDIDIAAGSFQAPSVERTNLSIAGNTTLQYGTSIMTYVAWLPDIVLCENPREIFSYETGLPTSICLIEEKTVMPSELSAAPEMHRIRVPLTESCETPAYQYDLKNDPAVSCLPKPTMLMAAMVAIPSPVVPAPHAAPSQNFQRCDDPSFAYPDFTDSAQMICLKTDEVISKGADQQYVFQMIGTIFRPEDCGAFDCQYTRVPEAEVQLEQFVAAPSLFSPAECENPPCRFAREVTFEPKFPNFMAPPSFAPAEPEVEVVAKSLHPDFRSPPSFVAPINCNDPPCNAPVSGGPILPSLPTINVLGAPPT